MRKEKARGVGPFEIIEKISPVAYRIRIPDSYRIHRVINIAHLEPYFKSPPEYGSRPTKSINRADFDERKEWDVERIVDETIRTIRGRKVPFYRVRYLGYGSEEDHWINENGLHHAPEILRGWRRQKERESDNHQRQPRQVPITDTSPHPTIAPAIDNESDAPQLSLLPPQPPIMSPPIRQSLRQRKAPSRMNL